MYVSYIGSGPTCQKDPLSREQKRTRKRIVVSVRQGRLGNILQLHRYFAAKNNSNYQQEKQKIIRNPPAVKANRGGLKERR